MRPYEQFSKIYDSRAGRLNFDYMPLVKLLCDRYGCRMRSVLDLACGTGALIAKLSQKAQCLVGLDISDDMLDMARENCRNLSNIDLVQGDYRSFGFNKHFDLILCCFDSLNYLQDVSELKKVFAKVEKHLENNGLFAFDVVNEKHCLKIHGISREDEVSGIEYSYSITYNHNNRILESTWRFRSGEERHRQIPIEYEDVVDAAKQTGFSLVDVFSNSGGKPIDENTQRYFFVFKKTA